MSAVMSSLGDDDVGDPYAALLAAGTLYPSEVTAVIACRRELQVLRWALALSSGGTEQRLHAAAAEAAAALLPEAFFHDVDDREEHIPLRPGEMVVRRATRAMRRCLVAVDDALHRLGAPDLPLPARRETHPNDAAGLFSLMSQAEQSSVPGPLTALLERGILQRMVPDLARLEGRVKHDGIHAFCTDAHLVRCGDIALGIVGGNDENLLGPLALPPPLLPVLRRLERPAVVVASALYHDIGKGLPGDHSLVGEEIVRRDLPGLGFADDDIDEVAFLVRHHLLLSMTAQRADLGDPRVVDGITAIVDTPEQLDALAVLTWCDWCAVGPGIATAWKGRLLADCVEAVREALLQPEKRARDQNAIRDRARRYLEPLTTIIAPAVMEAFVVDASASWLRGRTKEALQHDLRAFANLGARKPPQGLEHNVRPEGAFVDASQTVPQRAWVLVPDRAGLLADLAAAFASEGINVLDARLDVRANSDAFDCFVFDDGRGGLVPPDICRLLQVALEEAIAGQTRNVTKRRVSIPVSPRVRFLDGTNDQHFIVEVRCANRRGLLHDLARVFSAHELSITLARLHTEGQRVTDVFTAHPPPNFEDKKTSSGDPAATVEALRASLRTNLLVVAGG